MSTNGREEKESVPSPVALEPTANGNELESSASTSPSLAKITKLRRNLILFVLCSSQFFDIFNASAAILSLPKVSLDFELLFSIILIFP